MIINLLFNVFILLFGSIFVFLPTVTISSIPFIGEDLYSVLALAVGYWNTFLQIFPFSVVVWHMFLWIILPFEILFIIAKVFFGSRLPANIH